MTEGGHHARLLLFKLLGTMALGIQVIANPELSGSHPAQACFLIVEYLRVLTNCTKLQQPIGPHIPKDHLPQLYTKIITVNDEGLPGDQGLRDDQEPRDDPGLRDLLGEQYLLEAD